MPTPLQHERATVLDRYFTGIETKVIDKPVTFDGAPLMDRLAARQHSPAPGAQEIVGAAIGGSFGKPSGTGTGTGDGAGSVGGFDGGGGSDDVAMVALTSPPSINLL